MATSYANYTGGSNTTSAIYTVPAGKIAKIIITNLDIQSGGGIVIGSYTRNNDSGNFLYSRFSSTSSTGTTNLAYFETEDIIVPRRNITSFTVQCMMLKRSHILLAGQSINFSASDGNNTISFTVIEEDV
jgi:hypothetical protein